MVPPLRPWTGPASTQRRPPVDDERREIARSRGYPDGILDKLMMFEKAVREKNLRNVVDKL